MLRPLMVWGALRCAFTRRNIMIMHLHLPSPAKKRVLMIRDMCSMCQGPQLAP
jgi:hypothetical protein